MEDLIAWLIASFYVSWKDETGLFAPYTPVVNDSADGESEDE